MPAPFSAHEPMHLLTELPGYQAVKSRFCAAAWSPRSDNEGRKPNSYRPGPASPRRTSRSVEKTCGQSSDRGRIRQRLGILDATFEGEICHSGFRCHGVDSTSRPNIRWSERTPTPESTAVTRGLIGFKQQSGVIRNVLDPTTVAAAVFFNAADPRFASRRRTDRRTLPPRMSISRHSLLREDQGLADPASDRRWPSCLRARGGAYLCLYPSRPTVRFHARSDFA